MHDSRHHHEPPYLSTIFCRSLVLFKVLRKTTLGVTLGNNFFWRNKRDKNKMNTDHKDEVAWHPHKFKEWERVLFDDEHLDKWVQADTIKDGNCSLDALAIVWKLPRTQRTFEILRFRLARLLPETRPTKPLPQLVAEQAYIRRKGSWLSDEDIVELVNNARSEIIPVIFDARFDPDALKKFEALSQKKRDTLLENANKKNKLLSHQHTMFLGITPEMVATTRRIQQKYGLDARYILLQHVHGGHWIVLGRQEETDKKQVQTLFAERELPIGLMDVFETHLHVWDPL